MHDSLKRVRIVLKKYNSEEEVHYDYIGRHWEKYIDDNMVSRGDNYKYKEFLNDIVFNSCSMDELEYLKLYHLSE